MVRQIKKRQKEDGEMPTRIYTTELEDGIVQAHRRKDRKERAELRKKLSDAIRRHLDEVRFWDERSGPEEQRECVAGMSAEQVQHLYPSICLLVLSLEDAQQKGAMWPEDKRGPRGFTGWYTRLGRRLGSRTCNRLGLRMCKDAGFTVAKGQEILAALGPFFYEYEKRKKKEKGERLRSLS